MNLTNNPLPLFAAIMVGIVAQQVLTWLKQRGQKTVYTIARLVVLIFWIALGLVMMIGGAGQVLQDSILNGISSLALGLGLALSGLGQTLERKWLKIIGVMVLAAGPIVAGIGFILSGDSLGGMIALALGLGILASSVQGWISGIGQMIVGAVIVGSSVMMLIGVFVTGTGQPDFTAATIAVAMFILGLVAIVGGAMTIIGTIRRPAQAGQATQQGGFTKA